MAGCLNEVFLLQNERQLQRKGFDGAYNTEFFDSNTPPPQVIAIISPSVGNYREIWPAPAKKELQIKKGP